MTLPRQPHPRYSESHRVAVLFLSDRVQPVVKADGVSIPHGGLPLQLSAALGAGVSHLVMVALLLIRNGYTEQNLHEVMFAHPTLDEIVAMSILAPRTAVGQQ